MDAYPLLARIAELLDRHGLEAVLIGNAAEKRTHFLRKRVGIRMTCL